MRITLTLDPDVAEMLTRCVHEKGLTKKEAVNQALRAGLHAENTKRIVPFKVEPHACGFKAGIDLDRFNQAVDDLDAS
jgi:hypothetical protein